MNKQQELKTKKLALEIRIETLNMTEADIEPFSRNIIETKQRLLTKAYLPFREEWAAELYRERL